ncbi:MAG TPA: phosphoenolpyruvate synthase [Vicinamibacterales bacterium]|nr:phosphoenolpyruvate synthase [Vicinamibacterales bacterium]
MDLTRLASAPAVRLIFAADGQAVDPARLGGKASGLLRLARVGAAVPPWFAVPVDAFESHLLGGHCDELIASELDRLRRAAPDDPGLRALLTESATRLGEAVISTPMDDALADAIRRALTRLGDGPFAVRSSMVGEDSASHSYAGQLDSFLYQADAAAVLESVRRCWASAFGERVLAYRARLREFDPPRMGVIVQRMIAGSVSGVLFTADAVARRADQSLLTACWGLGEGIVGGTCDTDEYVWHHATGRVRTQVAHKAVQVVAAAGGGTSIAPVPPELQDAACLTDAEVARICKEGLRIAEAFGGPQDVEWTIARGALHVLQARPITSDLSAPSGATVVWDNSNIQESFCGVTTPLTFSVARRAYASVYEQSLRVLGVSPAAIADLQPVFQRMLGLIGGRVYYNINNWYRVLQVFPSFKRNKDDMERMMGLDSPVDFIVDERLSARARLVRLWRLARVFVRLKIRFAALDRDVERFMADTTRTLSGVDRSRLAHLELSELLAIADRVRRETIQRWHTPIVNDIYVMMTAGGLRRVVERASGARAAELHGLLLGAEEGVESVEPTRRLLRMARLIRPDAALRQALVQGEPGDALARMRAASPEFAREFDDYLETYGDRCAGELKLETVSLRQDPVFAVRVLRAYVEGPDLDPDRMAAEEAGRRRSAEREVARGLGPLARWRFARRLRQVRSGIRWRERMRLQRTRAFGLFRDIYRAVGERLQEAGRLDAPRDVFFLTDEEIVAYHDGTAVTADLAALARARIAEYNGHAGLELPNRIETIGAVYHGQNLAVAPPSDAERAERVLRGLACSPGVVEAPLSVVLDAREAPAMHGRILTTLRTDPGWAPLFPAASGILVERGSTLSHSAVLARELGIPAIVGVRDLLRIVRDGERVRLDGSRGTVERLSLP